MSTVAVTRLIDAPPARVWQTFTDLAARARQLTTVNSVEVVTTGPFAPGTVWRETRATPDGTPVTEEFHVEQVWPGRRYTVASPGIGVDYRTTCTLTPIEMGRHRGGTLVTVVQEGSLNTPYARLLALIFGGLAARAVEGALRQDLTELARAATDTRDDPDAV
ncbi:MAG TPA: SRPBCC family protein [Micromonosporaceae bacterium]